MAIDFKLDLLGDRQLARSFSRFREGLEDLRPAWNPVSDELFRITTEQFDSEGKGQWQPLSDVYASRKAVLAPGAKMLVLTGRMKDSLTQDGGEHIGVMKKDRLEWGTKVKSDAGYPYPFVHQKGTRDGRVPARPIFDLTETEKRNLTRAVQRHLVDVAKKQGLL